MTAKALFSDAAIRMHTSMIWRRGMLLLMFLSLLAGTATAMPEEAYLPPSSHYGTVTLGGEPAPIGSAIRAEIDGVVLASDVVFESDEGAAYRLHLPGDDPTTPGREGGREGDPITLFLNGVAVDAEGQPTTTWHLGTFERLDLIVENRPADLALAKAANQNAINPGGEVSYTLSVSNLGFESATDITLVDSLPEHTELVAVSDGGLFDAAARTVTWPMFELAAGASVERSLTLRLVDAPPAELIEVVNRAVSNLAASPDPNPDNDEAEHTLPVLRSADLRLLAIGRSNTTDDPQTLEVGGSARITLDNTGLDAAPAGFKVSIFEDRDVDGLFDPSLDLLLGTETVTNDLAVGDALSLDVALSGTLSLRGNRLFAFADSDHAITEIDELDNFAVSTCKVDDGADDGATGDGTGPVVDSADLTVGRITVDLDAYPTVAVTVRVGNAGAVASGEAVPVVLYDGDPGEEGSQPVATTLATTTLADALEPGTFVDRTLLFESPGFGPATVYIAVGDPADVAAECDTTNNHHTLDYDTTEVALVVTLDDGLEAVRVGQEVSFTLRISNAGLLARTGIELRATLDEHAVFVAASGDGVLVVGPDVEVVWPRFTLEPGASIEQTMTLRVAETVPVGTSDWTQQATVVDDGSQGDDPTPGNNRATDVDLLVTLEAVAGGPYSGDEGLPIVLDGSGSSAASGPLASFAWDLDGDGEFDDAGGAMPEIFIDRNGTFTIALQVTNSQGQQATDTTTVTVHNVAPVVDAPGSGSATESATVSLGVPFFDPGLEDSHTATIDWGDGSVIEPLVIDATGRFAEGSHPYADDGFYTLEACVTDNDGGLGCDTIVLTVDNAAPQLAIDSSVDFSLWVVEGYGSNNGNWLPSNGGETVTQTRNSAPTVFYSDFPVAGRSQLAGSIRVNTTNDDDFVGFVVGFAPGDVTDPEADFLLIDWKQRTQFFNFGCGSVRAPRGLAVSRVRGLITSDELWSHRDEPCSEPDGRVEELQRATSLGNMGWRDRTTYDFVFELDATRLRIRVDGNLEIDLDLAALAGPADDDPFVLGDGRFGFYNFSQEATLYSGFTGQGLSLLEGDLAQLDLAFTDLGTLDTHTASVDWGDGTVEDLPATPATGGGTAQGSHSFADEGFFAGQVCVTDDDGGTGCVDLPVAVFDAPAEVMAGGDRLAYIGEGLAIDATFTDPGVLDTHTATIDWGDGVVEPAVVNEVGGSGSVDGLHHYADEGLYSVTVCVEDSRIATRGCDHFTVQWLDSVVDVALEQSADRALVRPGERVTFQLTVRNEGTREPEIVQLASTLPAHLEVVSASQGAVVDEAAGTLTWTLPRLGLGETEVFELMLEALPGIPFDEVVTHTAVVADDGRFGADITPANNFSAQDVVLWDGVTPRIAPPDPGTLDTRVSEGADFDLVLGFDDTEPTEVHTVTFDWGDGIVEPGTVSENGGQGTVSGSHRFAEDGVYTTRVCVTDSVGNSGCLDLVIEVTNATPVVSTAGEIDLNTWQVEEYVAPGDQGSANWQVSDQGDSVFQSQNSRPSVFFGDFSAFGTRIQGKIEVTTATDDDFVGFVLGYQPGDSSHADADFLLVDWKKLDQDCAFGGLAVSRVRGVPSGIFCTGALWTRATGDHFQALARGLNLGSTGWRTRTEYTFTFELDATRLRVFVDDSLEVDLAGDFRDGRLGFYNHSQEKVRYSAFTVSELVFDEGELADFVATFSDAGILDTHTADIVWGDGETSPGTVSNNQGLLEVQAFHRFLDDAEFPTEVCVTDDEGDTGCGIVEVAVRNLAPVVDAGADRRVAPGRSLALAIPFSDAGALDTHTAAVDWGDGSAIEDLVVRQALGGGTGVGDHTFVEAGVYTLTVCVSDDDGGTGCDQTTVTVELVGTTTQCHPEAFDAPAWSLALLGDADQGEATASAEELVLTGTGTSLYHAGDHAAFFYRELAGDDDFRIEVEVNGFPVDAGGAVRKTALLLRSGLGTYDPRVMVTYVPHMPADPASDPPTTALQFDFRALPGDSGTELGNTVFEVPLPSRLAIDKRGDVYTVFYSIEIGPTGEPVWIRPVDATFQGSVTLDLGPTLHAGVAVASYDADVPMSARLTDAAICRPDDTPPFVPLEPTPCDPDRAVDLVVFLDLSGSMTAPYPGEPGEPTITRLEAAQRAIGQLTDGLLARADGSRMALVTMAGHRTPEENLADAFTVHAGLSVDLIAVDSLVQGFDPETIDPGTTTPAALAWGGVADLLFAEHDGFHQPVVLWVTDGVPNIDAEGRGPDAYDLEAVQAISLRHTDGGFLPWGEVAWRGEFHGALGTFTGEPLANVMFEVERLKTRLPEVLVYGLALQGDGVVLGTFNEDLVDYAAFVGGGLALSASDTPALLTAIDALGTDLDCSRAGTSSLGETDLARGGHSANSL